MELTLKQEEGLKVCISRYVNHEKYTVISGYAGTGKSTLASFIVDALSDYGVDESDIVFTAYTGKACQVLARKGNKNVSTLHKLLYDFIPKPDGTFRKKPKVRLDYDIVFVDEVSMAPKSMMDALFQYPVYVICLGDPFQLPPVNDNEDNHLLDHPHVFLDEVVRQAEESQIIRLTMDIRNGNPIKCSEHGDEIQIYNRNELSTGMLQWADQILVATNKTRIAINRQMRALNGAIDEWPEDGDKIVCLRNYWDIFSDNEESLINGTIGYLRNSFSLSNTIPKAFGGGKIDVTMGDFETDIGDTFRNIQMDTHMIITGDKCVSKERAYQLGKSFKTRALVPYEFTYGYAITTHKAQGSSWPNVLVIEEKFPFDKEEHARWLYTATTRAEEKLVLIR